MFKGQDLGWGLESVWGGFPIFTELVQPVPPAAETVEPVTKTHSTEAVRMHDVHYARIEHHRALRRLAGELLGECLPLDGDERKCVIAGAAMLVRMRDGEAFDQQPENLTRDAARLFARLPDDGAEALKVLDILTKFLDYIEDGVIDLNGLTEGDPHATAEVIERAVVIPRGHLRLVGPD